MVRLIRCLATAAHGRGVKIAGRMVLLGLCCLGAASVLRAQTPPVHYLHQGMMPPGAIGSRQLQRGGPLPGFFQPVEIKAPPGALISLAAGNNFERPAAGPRRAGLLIGAVYRLRLTNIRLAEGLEVFPTVELIDRLYAPADQQNRFAIPIDITDDDVRLALDGKFVTRVIYLEDSRNALPARQDPQMQEWIDAAAGQDPLAVADSLGRPVAILRLGGRQPDPNQRQDSSFFYGSPQFMELPALPAPVKPRPPVVPTSAELEIPRRILPLSPGRPVGGQKP
jgi:hypothetical protein